jgi:hypothetical protein
VCELLARAKQVLLRELFAAARVHRRVPPPPSKVEPAASSFVEYKAATSHRPPPPCSSAWWSIHPSPRGFMNSGPTYVRMQLGTEPFPLATCHSGRCGCHGVWHTSSSHSRDWQSAQHRPRPCSARGSNTNEMMMNRGTHCRFRRHPTVRFAYLTRAITRIMLSHSHSPTARGATPCLPWSLPADPPPPASHARNSQPRAPERASTCSAPGSRQASTRALVYARPHGHGQPRRRGGSCPAAAPPLAVPSADP